MVQRLFGDVESLRQEVRALRGRINSILAGGQIIPAAIVAPGSGQANLSRSVIALFLNVSGADLLGGDVVVLDFTDYRRCTTSTTPADVLALGVVTGDAPPYADNSNAPVLLLGTVAALSVDGAVAAGDYIGVSTVAGKGASLGATPVSGAFAQAMTADVGGYISALVFPVHF